MKDSRSRNHLNHNSVQVRTTQDYPWHVLGHLANDLVHSLGVDRFSKIQNIVRHRDITGLMELSETWGPHCIASSDTRIDEFFAMYQVSSLLKKFQFSTDRLSRRSVALQKFKDSESACKSFNANWRLLADLADPTELACFTYAREFLSRLLGEDLPGFDRLTLWSRHGPGANLDTKERRISLYDKYSAWPYSCTSGAREYARLAIQADERWLGALEADYREKHGIEPWRILDQDVFWSNVLHVVPGNRITFVPKNYRTDRSIAIEPCMNLYLQLGVDGYIRRRLKRWGVDLDDQTKNQRLAWDGSKNWTSDDPFVTLDLAAASDTISLELCRLLLPPQWYRYLIRLRSPSGICGDEVISYEKISSMGNGYTFALESAIFASVCYAAEKFLKGRFDRDEIAVYGDDIIVRQSSSLLVIQMLTRFGFSLNHEKSFIQGPFRESCGADWLNGTSVRPVFLSNNPSTVMELWNDLNRLRRILSLRCWGFEFEVCNFIKRFIPDTFKTCLGPPSDEDFDSYEHTFIPITRYRGGLWRFKRLVVTPKHLKGENFLFRKLMHTLRPAGAPNPFHLKKREWGGARVADAGSRFAVTKSNSVTVGYSSSQTSIWSDEYNDLVFPPGD